MTKLELLTQEELEECIISEFNPIRVGFKVGQRTRLHESVMARKIAPPSFCMSTLLLYAHTLN